MQRWIPSSGVRSSFLGSSSVPGLNNRHASLIAVAQTYCEEVELSLERFYTNSARQAECDRYYDWKPGERGLCRRDTAPARRPEMAACLYVPWFARSPFVIGGEKKYGDDLAGSRTDGLTSHSMPKLSQNHCPEKSYDETDIKRQSSDSRKTSYDRMKRCRERKINIKASERVNLGSPLVDDRPIMNAVKYRVVSGVVWTNRTMVSSNTDTNRTGVLAVVGIGDSLLICLKCQ
ncbi:hypothetical protein PR048_030018 [Dryococelus australis]|uniref:Uncharacterized protein n=1 Tax=Dryococelus australis TaxID=614101 RepID=A0ABQ9G7R8_9NEOP|nr:hypothetical protein PR048_030018 [Dryococelus australis]